MRLDSSIFGPEVNFQLKNSLCSLRVAKFFGGDELFDKFRNNACLFFTRAAIGISTEKKLIRGIDSTS